MIIKLVGSPDQVKPLASAVASSLEELGLVGTVTVEETADEAYAKSLGITKFPALAIEESAIDFKDMIFEGSVPPAAELTAMFVSILGGETSGGCSSGGCGSCSGGCSAGGQDSHDHDHPHDHEHGAGCGKGCH